MSDLAPFIAATLRDKVVQDLYEENAKLRKQLADSANEMNAIRRTRVNAIVAGDALHGFDGIYRIAIAGGGGGDAVENDNNNNNNNNTVYAVEHFHLDGESLDGGGFQKISDCTLGDLLRQAQIFVNGVPSRPFRDLEMQFYLRLDDVDAFRADFSSSLEDALASTSWPQNTIGWANFSVFDFSDIVGVMHFDLKGVSKRQLLEFAMVDPDEFLTNPRPLNIERNNISMEQMVTFFGATTLVVFDATDDIG